MRVKELLDSRHRVVQATHFCLTPTAGSTVGSAGSGAGAGAGAGAGSRGADKLKPLTHRRGVGKPVADGPVLRPSLLAGQPFSVPAPRQGRRSGKRAKDTDDTVVSPPNADNVVWYVLELDGAHVAILRDFPEGLRPPQDKPKRTDVLKRWACVGLSAVGNRIRSMHPMPEALRFLHSLDLGLNHLTRVQGLDQLPHLTSLSLHHNAIADLSGLERCSALLLLDVSYNKIEALDDGLVACSRLQQLFMNGNQLEDLAGLESQTQSLTRLDAHGNQISDLKGLMHVPNLTRLGLADNRVANLPDARAVVLLLTALTDLSFQGNPVCEVHNYRMELMAPQLRTLDSVHITPQLRDHVRRARVEADLDKLGEATTEQYLALIEAEERRRGRSIGALREREAEFDKAFSRYRGQMQKEMSQCLEYVESLKSRTDMTWTVDDSTLEDWKRMLADAAAARRSVVLQAQARLERPESLTAEELSRRMHQELVRAAMHDEDEDGGGAAAAGRIEDNEAVRNQLLFLARTDPEKWREIKVLELALAARAEAAAVRDREEAEREAQRQQYRRDRGRGRGRGGDLDDATSDGASSDGDYADSYF